MEVCGGFSVELSVVLWSPIFLTSTAAVVVLDAGIVSDGKRVGYCFSLTLYFGNVLFLAGIVLLTILSNSAVWGRIFPVGVGVVNMGVNGGRIMEVWTPEPITVLALRREKLSQDQGWPHFSKMFLVG